tara:strand:+ start:2282 stop:2464 length:183 start_codon:yes stop_codon:yes gene_type:complete
MKIGNYTVNTKTGLGDRVHAIAQPIAGAIDKALGTNIKRCGACAKRREALNNMFPSKLDT